MIIHVNSRRLKTFISNFLWYQDALNDRPQLDVGRYMPGVAINCNMLDRLI